MKTKWMITSAVTMAATLLGACGAPVDTSSATKRSRLTTVSIPQTDVRNQMGIGFCWAYAGIGFIESKMKAEQGVQMNFSEEALGFYRIIEELNFYTKAYQSEQSATFKELTQAVKGASLQGWIVRRDPTDKEFQMRDTFELMDAYGVVPESEWNIKFTTPKRTDQMVKAVKLGYLKMMQAKGKTGAVTMSDYVAILSQPDAFGSRPPQSFVHNGRQVTSKDFVRTVAGFKAVDYALVGAESSRDVAKLIQATKQTLARGYSVPVGFGVNLSLMKNGTFSYPDRTHEFYDGVSQERAKAYFGKDGGHAVLITDFVNEGGREGAVSSSELRKELAKDSEELAYLKIKNSWGLNAGNNERGNTLSGASDGYYRLDLGYLKGEADAGFLSVVVPSDIAAAAK